MTNKIQKGIIAGVIGTAVMTLVMMIAPMMGLPEMSPPAMLSAMMDFPIIIGWIMHFMIGIVFALIYAFFFIELIRKVNSYWLKGTIFGSAALIFAQIMMVIMGRMFPMPPMEGSMMLTLLGSMIGHIIFGITVALIIKEQP